MVHLRDIQVQVLQRKSCQKEHLSFLLLAFRHLRGALMMLDQLLLMHTQLGTQFDPQLHLDQEIVHMPHRQPLRYVNPDGLPC